MASIGASSSDQKTVYEYVVKVPKNPTKKYNVMRFSGGDKMDFQKWTSANLNRDMSSKKIYQEEEVYPEFGAGSEYGRKQKDQARRLKYGMRTSKFKIDDQPWNLSVVTTAKAPYSSKNKIKDKMVTLTKDFAGRKEGGIGEGSMYFVFMQRPNNTFEAYPVNSWYNFTKKIKHRTLTDEEAEEQWEKRDKIMNHLNFMARKRLQLNEEKEEDEDAAAMSKKKKNVNKTGKSGMEANNGLLIHDEPDENELLMSESEGSSDEENEKKSKKVKKQKGLKHDAAEEGLEESDDGDGEGQEQDYNSDISSEEETANDSRVVPKGLDEQESSSSSEEEETKPEDAEAAKKQAGKKKGSGDEMSTSGESDEDSDIEKEGSALFMEGRKTPTKGGKKGSSSNSRSSTPNSELLSGAGMRNKLQEVARKLEKDGRTSPKVATDRLLGKRHAGGESSNTSGVKRQKMGGSSSGSNTPTKDLSQPQNIINEDTVRRYLQHKPITPKDLLKKFKTKKTGFTSEQIVDTVAKILKKLNPEQKKINGKMHLFLKQG